MTLFFEKIKDKILIFDHYFDKSIPFKGWIHNCLICENLSGKILNYQDNIDTIVCKNCTKDFKNKKHADLDKFIIDNKIYLIFK